MTATGEKVSEFDVVVARSTYVTNDAGEFVVALGVSDDGDGLVGTRSAKGKELVGLASTVTGNGAYSTTHHGNGVGSGVANHRQQIGQTQRTAQRVPPVQCVY